MPVRSWGELCEHDVGRASARQGCSSEGDGAGKRAYREDAARVRGDPRHALGHGVALFVCMVKYVGSHLVQQAPT